ncbi:HNH endonuclease [Roseiterribacter gracilis]|uniref:HNH endonuclease n=1 Tax=Roseiterribacter gracilis TaxID=2812848 RepID=UPI003B42E528
MTGDADDSSLLALFSARDQHCHWCGVELRLTRDVRDPARATREHLVPRHLGGSDDAENLALACAACNGARADGTDAPDPERRALLVRGLAGKTVPAKRRAKRQRRRSRHAQSSPPRAP